MLNDPSRRRAIGFFGGCLLAIYERHNSPDERDLDPEALAVTAAQAGLLRPAIGYVDYVLGPLAWLALGTLRWLVPAIRALEDLGR